MALDASIQPLDYIVMAVFLVACLGIGVYQGCIHKHRTMEEYLYGNRQMHLLPVGLSLVVTFQSAISCLGVPAEVYLYNTMLFYTNVGILLAFGVAATSIVPLLYPLKLNSAYEYLGRRFNSRSVQLLGTFIGMLKTCLYMSVVLYSPAVVLEAVADVPLWISVIVIGVVGTLYTAVGGFRSVVWTDVFQFVILYAGITLILIVGGRKVGSLGQILHIAKQGERTHFNVFLISIPLHFVFGGIMVLSGLVMYSYFASRSCDPVGAGITGSANQMMPYFVLLILRDFPALPGIFLAALCSGSLSSLSSGINSLSCNTVQDILVNYLREASQFRKTMVAKLAVFVYGTVAVALAYAMNFIDGPITQISATAFGACGGPYVGMFFLGAVFPQANWIGALTGGLVGIILNVWLALSAMFLGAPALRSPPIPTSGCAAFNGTQGQWNSTMLLNTTVYVSRYDEMTSPMPGSDSSDTQSGSAPISLYDLSYLYLGLTGMLVSLVAGLVVSLISNRCSVFQTDHEIDPVYIIPWLRGFWKLGNAPKESAVDRGEELASSCTNRCAPVKKDDPLLQEPAADPAPPMTAGLQHQCYYF